jgi:hypothetical protein
MIPAVEGARWQGAPLKDLLQNGVKSAATQLLAISSQPGG